MKQKISVLIEFHAPLTKKPKPHIRAICIHKALPMLFEYLELNCDAFHNFKENAIQKIEDIQEAKKFESLKAFTLQ